MDLLVASECCPLASVPLALSTDAESLRIGRECVSDHGKAACADLGGVCRTERDGYYWVSTLCIATGAMILLFFVQPAARKLQCTSILALSFLVYADTPLISQLYQIRLGE